MTVAIYLFLSYVAMQLYFIVMNNLRISIVLLLMFSLGLTTTAAYNATFQLKELYIPPDSVVKFKDIGSTLGHIDGLFCEVKIPLSVSDIYWAFPNNSKIVHSPQRNQNEYGNGSCSSESPINEYNDYNCTSLYYDGEPPERGQFHCILEWKLNQPSPHPIEYEKVPVNIVDLTILNITGPEDYVSAGDNITLSVSVSVEPVYTLIPYQWQLDGNDLSNSDTYEGVNTATLRIYNIQDEHKGEYRVSVAHSQSRFTNNVTITVVTVRAEIIPSQDDLPHLGDNDYNLTCKDTVINVDRASLQSPTVTYKWFKNSTKTILYQEKTISFRSLTYENTGNYSCQVSVNSSSLPHVLTNTTSPYPLITKDVIYQLSLDLFNDECKSWIHSDTENKVQSINQKIANKINSQCGTDVQYGIENDQYAFRCRTGQDGHVVYNIHLLQVANTTVVELVACMNSWVTKTAIIVINHVEYPLTKTCCGVLMDSDSDPFICPWLPPTPTSKSKLGMGEGIAIGLGIGTVIIVAILIIGVRVTRCRRMNREKEEHHYEPVKYYGT